MTDQVPTTADERRRWNRTQREEQLAMLRKHVAAAREGRKIEGAHAMTPDDIRRAADTIARLQAALEEDRCGGLI